MKESGVERILVPNPIRRLKNTTKCRQEAFPEALILM
jgi:hypothetical protein